MDERVERAQKATKPAVRTAEMARQIALLSTELIKAVSEISKTSDDEEYVLARQCPACSCDSYVIESREAPDGSIYRRRECAMCKKRFMTREIFDHMIDGKRDKLRAK